MNTYCPVRPRNSSMSDRTCSGVKATQSTTASNSRSPRAARTAAGSRTSARSTVASGGSGRSWLVPRFSTYRSMPRATASRDDAELMTPLPPMNRTFGSAMQHLGQQPDLVGVARAGHEDQLVAAGLLEGGRVPARLVRADRGPGRDLVGHRAHEGVVALEVGVGRLAGVRPQREVGQRELAGTALAPGVLPGLIDRGRGLGEHVGGAAAHDPSVADPGRAPESGLALATDDQLGSVRAGGSGPDRPGPVQPLAPPDLLELVELLVEDAAPAVSGHLACGEGG